MRRQTVFNSICGKRFVCHNVADVAKFILFVVAPGKVQVRGKLPKLKKSNPKVKALIQLKTKYFKDTK